MPRVRLFNTIFHLRKINAKLMLNSYKTIFSHFFISLNILSNNLSFLPFLLCWNASAKEGALGLMSKNFQVHFIHIKFFQETKLKKRFTIEPTSYTAMLLYLFFGSLLSTFPKKRETEKWPKAADSPLFYEITRFVLNNSQTVVMQFANVVSCSDFKK